MEKLFVILDVFSRDSLYKQYIKNSNYCNKGLIDFRKLVIRFEKILEGVLKKHGETKLREKKMFDDYKNDIVPFLGINLAYSEILEENHVESAKWKKTLLFFATSQPIPEEEDEREALKRIIQCLAAGCPSTICASSMVKRDAADIDEGPTPIHLMVVKETTTKAAESYKHVILSHMLKENKRTESLYDLNKVNLDNTVSKGHLLRGKTILNIVARTLDIKAIKILLNNGIHFDSYNNYKENMYHSLVRYAMVFPEKESKIIATMKKIEMFLERKGSELDTKDIRKKGRPESLWRMKNHERLTPLQLAAKYGRFELFQHILQRKVYRTNDREKESLDDDIFDITDIETIPVEDGQKKDKIEKTNQEPDINYSILFFIGNLKSYGLATRFVCLNVISKTITEKWYKYKPWVLLWMAVHVITMLLFSWSAIVRSRLGNPPAEQDSSSDVYDNVDQVVGSSTVIFLYGSVCFLVHGLSFIVYLYRRAKYNLQKPWSWYFILFILFGLCIIVDYAFVFDTSSYQNFLLSYNIILGWFLLIFFLHVFEKFGFFTALIQHTAIHLLQFGAVFGTLLIGFSLAMFVAMQKAKPHEDEDVFENIVETFVKMFTVMLGIGELSVLFSARQPVISVSIFVMFVLMTTLLLLNALIAVMSNTCSQLTSEVSRKAHVQLQRMHTIIHLEMFLPYRFCATAGKIKQIRNFWKSNAVVKRRMLIVRVEDEKDDTALRTAVQLFEHYFGSITARSKRKTTPKSTNPTQVVGVNVYQTSSLEITENSEQ